MGAFVFLEQFPRLQSTSVVLKIPQEDITTVTLENYELVLNDREKIPLKDQNKYTSSGTNITIRSLSTGYTSITLRSKQIAQKILTNDDDDTMDFMIADKYQWNFEYLQKSRENAFFRCGFCQGNVIYKLNNVRRILPMPSELWYEMLDFWHCHKPNEEDEHSRNVTNLQKFNELRPQEGCIIIGAYYMIVNPEDWREGIMKDDLTGETLLCGKCKKVIGELDPNFGNYKILNWNIELVSGGNNVEKFNPYTYVMAKLIDETRYSAGRMFTISYQEKRVKVWCFGEGINIEIAVGGGSVEAYKDCMKIMYQEYDSSRDGNLPIIEVEYEEPFNSFLEHITELNLKLPEPSRTFQNWNISYVSYR